MATPIISWYSQDNTFDVAANGGWNIGQLNAGETSPQFGLLVWNNRGGTTAVSDMNDCVITTVDTQGGSNSPVVSGKWVGVKVVSASEVNFSPIGGNGQNDGRPIKASGLAAGTISGAANDGTKANSTANFAELILQASPPLNSPAGTFDFNVRVSFTFT
jgi:hypothetical protein